MLCIFEYLTNDDFEIRKRCLNKDCKLISVNFSLFSFYYRQLEGKDASSHRLAVMETDVHELCNILRISDGERNTESGDKMKIQIRLCKNVSRKLIDEKENIERYDNV